jgi:hypothetical protein
MPWSRPPFFLLLFWTGWAMVGAASSFLSFKTICIHTDYEFPQSASIKLPMAASDVMPIKWSCPIRIFHMQKGLSSQQSQSFAGKVS